MWGTNRTHGSRRKARCLAAFSALSFLWACGGGPTPVAKTAAGLSAELIGNFECSGDSWRANLRVRADGRYLETERMMKRDGRWQEVTVDDPPCDPWGWIQLVDGTLTLEHHSATCEELGDPITIPRTRRALVVIDANEAGFTAEGWVCKRVE